MSNKPTKEPQITNIRQQLLDRSVTLEEEIKKLALVLQDVRHSDNDIIPECVVEEKEYVPLAADMHIVLERIHSCIGRVRTILDTLEL